MKTAADSNGPPMTLSAPLSRESHPTKAFRFNFQSSDLGTREAMQVRLDSFYTAHFIKEVFSERALRELSMPHLIAVQQEYVDAPLRIMFVGQETTDWVGTLAEYVDEPGSLARVQRAYTSKAQEMKTTSPLMRYRGRLSKEFLGCKPAAVGWANLLRMDWDQGLGRKKLEGKRLKGRTWASKGFDSSDSEAFRELSAKTLAFELDVLKPHVIIFGSGHGYDSFLKPVVGDWVTDVSNFIPKKVWPFDALGAYCIRLPHPNMRRRDADDRAAAYYYDIGFQLLRDRLKSAGLMTSGSQG
jgi:hypothetical protein